MEPQQQERRGRRRWWFALVVVVVVWLGYVGVSGALAAADVREGLDAMGELRGVVGDELGTLVESVGGVDDDVDEELAVEELRRAADAFGAAGDRLDAAPMQPLRVVPVLGRQLRSAVALSAAAETTTGAASDAVAELLDVLDDASSTSGERVDAIERSGAALEEFADAVESLDLGPDDGLLPPLADARNRFAEERSVVTRTLAEMTTALAGVSDFLIGPTDYVLVAANNAEMRAGSGMFLQAGGLAVEDGAFAVGDLEATENLVLTEPAGALDEDIDARWGQLLPGQEWRNTNLSPRFDRTAATVLDMWEAGTGERAEGVVAVDVVAVGQLLELTGPVTLPGGEVVSADNVVEGLLVEQYRDFGEDRDARRDRLGAVASAAFEALNTQPIGAGELMKLLRDLGAGRHLMMWSSVQVQQDAWDVLGLDGVPAPDSLLLSVLNRGGNKLDPYLEVNAGLAVDDVADGRRVEVRITATNRAPEGLPGYVAGPHPFAGLDEGEYRGIVALTMPGGAGSVRVDGGAPAVLGQDGPTRVAGSEIRLRRGESATVVISFELPAGWSELSLLGSARVPPTTWSSEGGNWTDDRPSTVSLEE